MKKVVKPICLLLTVIALTIFSILEMYANRYEGAQTVIDDERRIPLWFPYELAEFEFGNKIVLYNWNAYEDNYLCEYCVTGEVSRLQFALMLPNWIDSFGMNEHVVYGKRTLRDTATREYLGERYFLFATNLVAMKNFETMDDYIRECSAYGVDGAKTASFDENFDAYWSGPGRTTLCRIMRSFLRSGFSKGEMLFLAFVALLWFYAIKKLRKSCK